MSSQSDFLSGVRDVMPLLPGFLPFGVVTGVAATEVGMSDIEAIAMSALMFSGAAQLAAIDLLDQGAPMGVIIVTALMVNLRFSVFSAAVAPYLRSFSAGWKLISGFLLSTPPFVLSVAEFESENPPNHRWYYFGAALPVWLNWQIATIAGVVLGARIPTGLQLDFVIPLVFMALLFKILSNRATQVAAGIAGVIAIAGATLPLNLGLLSATFCGIAAGLLFERGVN